MSQTRKRFLFTAYAFGFMVAFALSGAMFSTALPRIISQYGITLAQAGLFPVFSSIGNLGSMVVTGLVGDHLPKSTFMGVIFTSMGVILLLVGTLPPFVLLLILMTALGIASSMLNLIVTAYVSDLYGDDRTRYINLLHVFYGIGSLLGPGYPMLLIALGFTWNVSYLVLAAVSLVASGSYFIILARLKPPAEQITAAPAQQEERTSYRALIRYRGMVALCVMSFLYLGGHQGVFSTWFQTYLQWEDPIVYTAAFTSVGMTLYWVGMAISRMAGAVLARRFSARQFILGGAACGTVVLLAGLLVSQPVMWIVTAFLLGICTGVIYPLTFAISCEWFPRSSARVSSFVGIFSSMGSIVFGWLVGLVAEVSFTVAMYIPVVALAIVFCIVKWGFPKTVAGEAPG